MGPGFAVSRRVRMRNLGLIVALVTALAPRPAQAQGDFIKSNLKHLIEKTGIYVSASTRTALDDEVDMGVSIGATLGFASEHQRAGRKYPIGFSTYSGDLETTGGQDFGRISARQIMSGIGYQWARGKLVYGGQLGVGYSFNKVTLDPGVAVAFGVPEPVGVSVSNSFVLRPQAKVEYFVHPKVSLRTQASFTYTDPDVVIHTVTEDIAHQWNTNHWQLSFAVGFFPLRK
jgi:hypothetical protein